MKRLIMLFIVFNCRAKLKKIECKLFQTPYHISNNCCLKSSRSLKLDFQSGTSSNWAGFVNLSHQNRINSVKKVSGKWIVPQLNRNLNNTYAATWVGIDGFSSPTVEQIGTEQEIINGQQVNYAWFEMYPRPSFIINQFPIAVGDVISASVTYIGNDTFNLVIKNITKGFYTQIPHSYTKIKAQRSCSEWIIEPPFYQRILPLADFSNAYFSNCTSTIHGVNSAIINEDRVRVRLDMVNQNNQLKAKTYPLTNQGKNFRVQWKHQ